MQLHIRVKLVFMEHRDNDNEIGFLGNKEDKSQIIAAQVTEPKLLHYIAKLCMTWMNEISGSQRQEDLTLMPINCVIGINKKWLIEDILNI